MTSHSEKAAAPNPYRLTDMQATGVACVRCTSETGPLAPTGDILNGAPLVECADDCHGPDNPMVKLPASTVVESLYGSFASGYTTAVVTAYKTIRRLAGEIPACDYDDFREQVLTADERELVGRFAASVIMSRFEVELDEAGLRPEVDR